MGKWRWANASINNNFSEFAAQMTKVQNVTLVGALVINGAALEVAQVVCKCGNVTSILLHAPIIT